MPASKKLVRERRLVFAAAVAAGQPMVKAYQLAYPRSKGKYATQAITASQVAAQPEVQEMIAKLREEAAELFGWERNLWIAELTAQARACPRGTKGRLEALVEVGKALGYYEQLAEPAGGVQARTFNVIVLPPGPEEQAILGAIEGAGRQLAAPVEAEIIEKGQDGLPTQQEAVDRVEDAGQRISDPDPV